MMFIIYLRDIILTNTIRMPLSNKKRRFIKKVSSGFKHLLDDYGLKGMKETYLKEFIKTIQKNI